MPPMRIVTGKAKAIESGKAHILADFQNDDDVTQVRIENLTEGHALEVFVEEGAVAGVDSYSIPAKVSEKTPSFLTIPYNGGTLYGAGVTGEVSFRVIGAPSAGPVGISTGTA